MPGDAEAHGTLAWLELQSGRAREALASAERAIGIEDSVRRRVLAAIAAISARRPAAAEEHAARVIAAIPDDPVGHELAGHAALMRARWSQAAAGYARALERDGRRYHALVGRGLAHARRGSLAAALRDWEAAREVDPTDALAYGWIIGSVRHARAGSRLAVGAPAGASLAMFAQRAPVEALVGGVLVIASVLLFVRGRRDLARISTASAAIAALQRDDPFWSYAGSAWLGFFGGAFLYGGWAAAAKVPWPGVAIFALIIGTLVAALFVLRQRSERVDPRLWVRDL